MALISVWSSNPEAIKVLKIDQVVTLAGDGNLKDSSECAAELRSYFSELDRTKIASYVEHCLTNAFPKSGMVLQDIVNELGRRLDYEVTNGRYQGSSGSIGFDGLWKSPEGHFVIAEVKTTDAYRISLDTLATYRDKLVAEGKVGQSSSILIVVGRQDTGDLEAQIRGSKHAWDIRLISVAALIRLVQLKEESDEAETGKKIRSLLVPKEYTRLDGMIDVMFAAAKDVEGDAQVEESNSQVSGESTESSGKIAGVWQVTDAKLIQAKRDQAIAALGQRERVVLIKKTRATYVNSAKNVRAACTISKRHTKSQSAPYWYAYHPSWDQFLGEGATSYLVLGCMDRNEAFAIPLADIRSCLKYLNPSGDPNSPDFWIIHLRESEKGELALILPKQQTSLPLIEYRLTFKA